MLIKGKHHVTYCTNIHPGQDWDNTFKHIKKYVPEIKKQVAPNIPFGLGLRLSNKASEQLNEKDHLSQFKKWLDTEDVYVFTMNGFPYGNFHDERVKDKVHAPDWTTPKRLSYTKRLFQQLAILLPAGISGGISTSPITYRHWHTSEEDINSAFETGAKHFTEIISHLYQIEEQTGKYLHLDIEPEPDGLLENSDEVIRFFEDYLIPIATTQLKSKHAWDQEESRKYILRYITLCYDICHFSLAYEEPMATFKKLAGKGIGIGKIQVSAALKILSDQQQNNAIWETLSRFDEPTYLHQVTEKIGDQVRTYNDLPALLKAKPNFKELRAHFHVPIFLEQFEALYSTQDHILKVIEVLKEEQISDHLEIETYTWDVLPAALKKDLVASVVREINWLKERL
ncbi:metabolite traffic protein EboE [Muriicola sp. Z0-33]|uniref:metabolite traffic protein EboE n=1 Tax=Muriicola sp. Z0-33 TaxID=2816957 RepID=UPI0022378D27|nr:metabolite traffic protein EboE [Muriicola sp. Z0-33]MCW5517451.1 metabolite traffic protein EboE [Muriicola sp. Z0-33]